MSLVMIKYGELNTKKANRNYFVKTLAKNIKYKLKEIDIEIENDLSRMFIKFSDEDKEYVNNSLKEVFGIYEFSFVKETSKDLEEINNRVMEFDFSHYKTFRVSTKRSDKTYPFTSMEISRKVGAYILKNTDLEVDLHNPDIIVNIEIRKDRAYVYSGGEKGLGGYPAGTQKKSIMMLSGGIDSPVAAFLAMKRGIKLEMIYFESLPHTSLEAREKVLKLTEELSRYSASKIKVHVINFTKMQEAIYKHCDHKYMITIMRRMMYRISEKLARKRRCLAIINGESVGQVASQTITSMNTIEEVTNFPVIRPVACLDKEEIIDLAKKINTYEISIIPYDDCCTVFVPEHPAINPSIEKARSEENKFDYEAIIREIFKDIITINIPREKETFDDVL